MHFSPWKKPGKVNSWRKWLQLKSGGEHDPLPESAVTMFRTVQANWADPQKIAGMYGVWGSFFHVLFGFGESVGRLWFGCTLHGSVRRKLW